MSVKLATEHHLEFLCLKGGCTGLYESTLVKIPHCWKSYVTAHFICVFARKIVPHVIHLSLSRLCCSVENRTRSCETRHLLIPQCLYPPSLTHGCISRPELTNKWYKYCIQHCKCIHSYRLKMGALWVIFHMSLRLGVK